MTTISRHDSKAMLLNIVNEFITEIRLDFQTTNQYDEHRFYYEDAFTEIDRILNILKDKP
jgi:hypothetical protein